MTDAALKLSGEVEPVYSWSDAPRVPSGRDSRDDRTLDDVASGAVSANEISALVSGALHDAMLATAKPCPVTYLDVLESQKRDRITARMSRLPSVQFSHPVVQSEVLKELAMMRAQSKLAKGIVESIRDYARSKRRAEVAAMT